MACILTTMILVTFGKVCFLPLMEINNSSVIGSTTRYLATRNKIILYMTFVEDLEALVAWTSKF